MPGGEAASRTREGGGMSRRAIVQFSGGVGSWAAARRTVERFDDVTLLFADTLIEDADLYRFLDDAERDLGIPITRISDGRNPWEVFRDRKFIGNTRVDPCSLVLKRELLRAWIDEHGDPDDTTIVLGIDWSEIHRLQQAIPRWKPWTLIAPLCDESEWGNGKDVYLAELAAAGIKPPRLYEMGFPHNNCGGFCVKAGQAQFKLLLDKMPERYLAHEREEEATRVHIGKDVSILRDRSQKGIAEYEAEHGPITGQADKTVPLTLRRFRERLGVDASDYDAEEWGGCGCAID